MTANILDGKKISLQIINHIALEIKKRKKLNLAIPTLAVILIGENSASKTYIKAKEKACVQAGIEFQYFQLPENISLEKLITVIEKLNNNNKINGILIQLPLPSHIDKKNIIEKIAPEKDVDGFHPYNLGRLCQRKPNLRPCTPKGIMYLLKQTNVDLVGLDAIVIGASEIVGRPMALELLLAGCTVTVAHRFTKNLSKKIIQANIIIAATGTPELVRGSWLQPNSIVIDVGITRIANGSLCGDVEFSEAQKKVAWITPVPGGVGPMTVASLLENTLQATIKQNNM